MPVRAGEPILNSEVKVVRVARLGGGNDAAKVTRTDEFELKRQVRDLFEELEHLHDGTVIRLEFRHGLPFVLETAAHITPGAIGLTERPVGIRKTNKALNAARRQRVGPSLPTDDTQSATVPHHLSAEAAGSSTLQSEPRERPEHTPFTTGGMITSSMNWRGL